MSLRSTAPAESEIFQDMSILELHVVSRRVRATALRATSGVQVDWWSTLADLGTGLHSLKQNHVFQRDGSFGGLKLG